MAFTFHFIKDILLTLLTEYTSYSIHYMDLNIYHIDNTMSDTESDFDTEELEREFDEVLVQLTSIQEIQEDALLRLERLQGLQRALKLIDLEMIETMHTAALHEISQTGTSSFGTNLLNYLESHKN